MDALCAPLNSSNIPLDQAPLVTVLFEPAVGVILAQHAGHKLLGKDKIVEKIDRDLPPLLGCKEAPEDRVGWAWESS